MEIRGFGALPLADRHAALREGKVTSGRILVADDDAQVREWLCVVLEHLGYSVEAVGSGRQLLERLEFGPAPQTVVVDACMPDGDGAAVLSRIKCDPRLRRIRVGVVSGRVLRSQMLEDTWCFPDFYLPKPCTLNQLRAAVRLA